MEEKIDRPEDGVSLVVANTAKGSSLLKELAKTKLFLVSIEQKHSDMVIKDNIVDTCKIQRRNEFFRFYKNNGYRQLMTKYASRLSILLCRVNGVVKRLRKN